MIPKAMTREGRRGEKTDMSPEEKKWEWAPGDSAAAAVAVLSPAIAERDVSGTLSGSGWASMPLQKVVFDRGYG